MQNILQKYINILIIAKNLDFSFNHALKLYIIVLLKRLKMSGLDYFVAFEYPVKEKLRIKIIGPAIGLVYEKDY